LIFLTLPSGVVSQDPDSLKIFLQSYVGEPLSERNKTTRYMEAWADLDGDGKKEAIVYLSGGGWCGSGGCKTLVLKSDGFSFKLITKISLSRLPICMLSTKSHSWHDLTILVQGGGTIEPYEAELRFNGNTYPSNPTVAPAQPLRQKAEGKVLISYDDYKAAKPLYP
jgi:hypothetical protein